MLPLLSAITLPHRHHMDGSNGRVLDSIRPKAPLIAYHLTIQNQRVSQRGPLTRVPPVIPGRPTPASLLRLLHTSAQAIHLQGQWTARLIASAPRGAHRGTPPRPSPTVLILHPPAALPALQRHTRAEHRQFTPYHLALPSQLRQVAPP